ncbi:MAG TPA: hypothetical protein VH880_14100 [Anaeromyxobacteraceae bacterium]
MSDAAADRRAEHDALAARLAVRRSIDHVRRAAYAGFFAFVTSGLAVKLAWDRWFSTRPTRFRGPPFFFFAAAVVALVLLAGVAREAARARRLMREEDQDFARLRKLRAGLGLDA